MEYRLISKFIGATVGLSTFIGMEGATHSVPKLLVALFNEMSSPTEMISAACEVSAVVLQGVSGYIAGRYAAIGCEVSQRAQELSEAMEDLGADAAFDQATRPK